MFWSMAQAAAGLNIGKASSMNLILQAISSWTWGVIHATIVIERPENLKQSFKSRDKMS
jgi:hypothetical protein